MSSSKRRLVDSVGNGRGRTSAFGQLPDAGLGLAPWRIDPSLQQQKNGLLATEDTESTENYAGAVLGGLGVLGGKCR
jgi:hypothetical protein